MRAPEHERQALRGVIIQTATEELKAPIDRVEVEESHARCWAGSKMVVLSYYCSQTGEHDAFGKFTPYVGGGSWHAEIVRDPTLRQPTSVGNAIAKLMRKGIFGGRRP
jgi:hypothetical protein